MTHLDDLHTLLSERAHLRAQRDELQRDCTRLEAEARAAREEVRKLRAEQKPSAIPSHPKCEDKPAHVARWRRCQTLVAWQLIDIAAPLVLSTMREDAEHGQFVATAGMSSFRESFLKECAMLAEDHLRAIGIIPAGPIDRSALNGLRRNVDPGTHNAARMATRPHRGTALRRRGNAARDGTRRRRLLGQWRWRQSDRHWRHPRAMRRRRRAMGHRERRSARWPHRPERVRMTDAPWVLAASYHDDPAIVATAWRIAALQRELLELSYVLATLLIKAKSKRDLA